MSFSLPTIPIEPEPRISLTEVWIEIKPRLLHKYVYREPLFNQPHRPHF